MSLKLFGKQSFVGIDLGHHTIKVVQLEQTAHGWRVNRSGIVPTPPESIKDGVVVQPQPVAEAIRGLMQAIKLSATSAIISVAGGSVAVRCVKFPAMPEAALRKSIRFEAGRYVPSSVDDSFIEFEIIGPAEEGQMEVLIVAAPKDIVESRIQACSLAGLKVEIVDIEAFAMYRSLLEAHPDFQPGEETIALVDVGACTTNVSVVTKGIFAMTRSIPQGGNTLTNALKSYFKLTPQDAEVGKSQLDLSELLQETPAENPPLRVLQPFADEMVREIRRSLNYYQAQQTESGNANPVTRIVVSGGGAKMRGLGEYFSQKLGMPVTPVGVFENPRVLSTSEDVGAGLDFSVASGLAMRAFGKAA